MVIAASKRCLCRGMRVNVFLLRRVSLRRAIGRGEKILGDRGRGFTSVWNVRCSIETIYKLV